jgi:hypothetical protein
MHLVKTLYTVGWVNIGIGTKGMRRSEPTSQDTKLRVQPGVHPPFIQQK